MRIAVVAEESNTALGRSSASIPMSTLTLLTPDNPRWRVFATEHATSPLQHPAWLDALMRAYGLTARIAALIDSQGAILAALPMIHSKLPWRRRWTSLPFTDTFEPVALDGAQRDELLLKLAEDGDQRPILIRTHAPLRGWASRQLGTVQVIDVAGGAEAVLRQVGAGTRRQVKRAHRPDAGLTARPITSREEFLGAGSKLMAQSRQRLGAPTQPRRYWSEVWKLHELDEALTIGVYLAGKLVAEGVFLVGNGHAVYKYGASDPASWNLRTNYLMFTTAFDHIAARGVSTLDFGITGESNVSLRRFKTQWGGEERAAFFSATDDRLLPDSIEPGRLITRTIQHTPVQVGRAIGSLAYPFVA
jgi:CelD/BcsL family acetyltransferase involved in cellulose biosynthesis